MRFGAGDGTTRRRLSPSGLNSQPRSERSASASRRRIDRADRLARIGERRVVGVDLDHREQRGQRALERQPIAELLLDQVADHALGLGAEHVERIHRDRLVRAALEREKPDLRTVAVRDHELVRQRDRSEVLARDRHVRPLVLDRHRLTAVGRSAFPPSATTTLT